MHKDDRKFKVIAKCFQYGSKREGEFELTPEDLIEFIGDIAETETTDHLLLFLCVGASQAAINGLDEEGKIKVIASKEFTALTNKAIDRKLLDEQ